MAREPADAAGADAPEGLRQICGTIAQIAREGQHTCPRQGRRRA
jgi:hypothetical protein